MHPTMIVSFDTEIPMRDGVVLRGDLYRPDTADRAPVLLLRTVFSKDLFGRGFGQYDPAWFVRRGYAVYIQDVRGLGKSDGEFDRFTADGKDGYDTIEYLARQPYCDGGVGMMGSYFSGFLQIMAAAEEPPHLKAMIPMQTSVSINRDCDNRGFLFYSHIGWCMSRLISRLREGRYDEKTTAEYLPKLLDYIRDYPERQLKAVPLTEMPAVKDTPFRILQDYFHQLVEGYDDMALIHKEGRDMDMTAVRVPAFYVSGWYDSSRTPLIDHCRSQREAGVDSRVLIAPWKPGEPPARVDGPLETGESVVSLQEEMTQWFDHWLKNGPAPSWPAYRFGDIASDGWFGADAWPCAGEAEERWYFRQDGGLSATPPEAPGSAAYTHDPASPLPYRPFGGAGQWRRDADEKRATFLSEPLAEPRRLLGLVRAEVFLSSDAKDADVMLSLSAIDSEGRRFVICDGATRARYREDWTSRPLEAGEVYRLEVLLGHVHYTIPAGSRLLVEIAGSAFPKYDINHGTAKPPVADAEWTASHNRIHFGPGRTGGIRLPLAERAGDDHGKRRPGKEDA